MGKKYDPANHLEAARSGDEDALELVLGGICAPVFDLALHLHRHPVRADLAAVASLRELASTLRGPDDLPHPEPLALAARALVAAARAENPPPPTTDPVGTALAALPETERAALLTVLALDLDREALAHALDTTPELAESAWRRAVLTLEIDPDALRTWMDEVAAEVPLPRELIDRALAS